MRRSFIAVLVTLAAATSARAEQQRPTTGFVPLPPGMGRVIQGDSPTRILFLNRCAGGCTFTPGFDDSRVDQSSIVGQTSFLAEYPWGDDSWDRTVACVKTLYAGFDIEITDQDPGDVPHFEAVVAGEPGDVGMDPNVGGVAPFDCGIIDNAITFTFATKLGNQPQTLCEVIGQESAHAFGLDHELDCQDPMTYLDGCGNKCFQDTAARCGEQNERECWCGGDTQNSYRMLADIFGTRTASFSAAVSEPQANTTVLPGFFVRATGNIPCLRSIAASLVRDGVETPIGELFTWPYVFNTPSDLAPGPMTVRVVATDHAGASYEDAIAIMIGGDNPAPDAGIDQCDNCGGGGCAAGPSSDRTPWILVGTFLSFCLLRPRKTTRQERARS